MSSQPTQPTQVIDLTVDSSDGEVETVMSTPLPKRVKRKETLSRSPTTIPATDVDSDQESDDDDVPLEDTELVEKLVDDNRRDIVVLKGKLKKMNRSLASLRHSWHATGIEIEYLCEDINNIKERAQALKEENDNIKL